LKTLFPHPCCALAYPSDVLLDGAIYRINKIFFQVEKYEIQQISNFKKLIINGAYEHFSS
jgi:hypothetical protein